MACLSFSANLLDETAMVWLSATESDGMFMDGNVEGMPKECLNFEGKYVLGRVLSGAFSFSACA